MGFRPEYMVADYETELGGRGSTEFWHPGFRVSSAAFSWVAEDGSIRSEFVKGETAVEYFLERCIRDQIGLVAHNAQFEIGVTECRFPSVAAGVVWLADTMRLVQNYDNGGDAFALALPVSLDEQLDAVEAGDDPDEPEYIGGLGLVNSVRRILNEPDHKAEAYAWIRENVSECRPGREGQFLTALPHSVLVRYNVGDTEATLRLFRFLTRRFQDCGYDWRLDHALYMSSVRRIVEAKIRGVRVDRGALASYAEQVRQEIEAIGCDFCTRFAEPIRAVERDRLLNEVRKRKTLRGRRRFVRRVRGRNGTAYDAVRFNVGSNKQLEALFVAQMGMEPRFRTDKGAPSFRSAVLGQWGEGGETLKKRRKRLLVLKQCEALLELSAHDGRWHLDLRAAGTATGRFSGGQHT
jgi:hypothetical protein